MLSEYREIFNFGRSIFSNNCTFHFVDKKLKNTGFLLECQNENVFSLNKEFNIGNKVLHILFFSIL